MASIAGRSRTSSAGSRRGPRPGARRPPAGRARGPPRRRRPSRPRRPGLGERAAHPLPRAGHDRDPSVERPGHALAVPPDREAVSSRRSPLMIVSPYVLRIRDARPARTAPRRRPHGRLRGRDLHGVQLRDRARRVRGDRARGRPGGRGGHSKDDIGHGLRRPGGVPRQPGQRVGRPDRAPPRPFDRPGSRAPGARRRVHLRAVRRRRHEPGREGGLDPGRGRARRALWRVGRSGDGAHRAGWRRGRRRADRAGRGGGLRRRHRDRHRRGLRRHDDGLGEGEATVDIERIAAIRAVTPAHLALHGGTGVRPEQLVAAIGAGITKVSYFHGMAHDALDALRAVVETEPHGMLATTLDEAIRPAFRDRCRQTIRLYGGPGRAPGG